MQIWITHPQFQLLKRWRNLFIFNRYHNYNQFLKEKNKNILYFLGWKNKYKISSYHPKIKFDWVLFETLLLDT